MLLIVTIAVLLISTPLIWWYLLFLRKFKSLNAIPGPKPSPIIGSGLDIGNTPQELLTNLSKWSKQYGSIFKIFIANDARVVIGNPDVLEQILNSNIHITKSNAYDLLKPWLGIGLLISTGKKWKARRKMITPTFHFKILDQFLHVFNSCGNILVKKLSREVGKDSVDVYPYINLCSLDIICETSMGVRTSTQEGNNTQYVSAVRSYLDIFTVRMFSAVQKFDFLFQFHRLYTAYETSLALLHKFSNGIILRRRDEKSQQSQKKTKSEDDDGIKRKVALLDMLLESEDSQMLSNEDIREEIDTFMFEGHDTVTSGMSFAILALADNQEVQEKVYEEIMAMTDDENDSITMQELQNTKYLEMVVKEVQRVYPSVPFFERRLETDCNLGGYDFPKDTFLNIFTYGMHHDAEYYPEPEKFDPNRFLPESQSKRHNFAYVPFSAGPRNCIGQKFAMLEMKATIIKIVKNFKILPVANFKPDLGTAAVLKSYNGVRVKLQHRRK